MKLFVCSIVAFRLFFVTPDFADRLSKAAVSIADDTIVYDGKYTKIPYPNGDVSNKKGVCTDVVIRAYRKLGIDLQQKVHEDMAANFSKYPKTWGLKTTDTNIDHRRVPNLQVFFTRKGQSLGVSKTASGYKPGDLVTWMINDKLPHIGIVTHLKSADGKRPLLMHNVGGGQVLEDCLFAYEITGHYRYVPIGY
ncbi:DUF1287 domain-containing protein [Flavobacterium silvaticum]|uniref:DUF1287 domain-containing protein n=1 Tax=Flavobacterium silvaticum TaxID=1852020 RepID=A0A972FP15_9FLAO|nr:DUF1287 domain-containing protein [Flavobacterium silvaticum]NMH29604.1 DUF1287 domain-containing protein [Flavobacterium silvaticum]